MTACTIGPTATTGARCGAPAVVTFGPFAECAAHAFKGGAPLVVGGPAILTIHGLTKIVTILTIGRTRATVRVPVAHGTVTRTVALAELREV